MTTTTQVRRPARRKAVAVGVGALLVVLVAGGWRYASTHEDVPVPPADASPEQVVRSYVAAIDGRDRDTVRALSVPGYGDQVADTWFGTRLEDVSTSDAVADPGPDGTGTGPDRVNVPVEMVVRHGDGSIPEGEPFGWAYVLVQDTDSGRWLVADQGVG